ncbi:MAG TPA: hypothetical protein VEL76_14985, partial [Gemmataceae bacterium]|nr:hypothetical protein [Gemmataceae bacterium]
MSKTNLVPWTILDEAAAAKCGHFPGVRVNPTKEPSIGVSFTLKTLEPAPILAAAEKLAEMPTAKLDAGVAALPTRAAVQEAAGQVEAA